MGHVINATSNMKSETSSGQSSHSVLPTAINRQSTINGPSGNSVNCFDKWFQSDGTYITIDDLVGELLSK